MYAFFRALTVVGVLALLTTTTYGANKSPTVVWTAVFADFTPLSKNISYRYCKAHTPSVIVTTIKQITSKKGIRAVNGINIRYLSYKTVKKNHLYFNIVNAVVRGITPQGKSWSAPMKLYEQTLSPIGVTYTVWSTPKCKGTFIGTPSKTTHG